jgi:hypothetical protein
MAKKKRALREERPLYQHGRVFAHNVGGNCMLVVIILLTPLALVSFEKCHVVADVADFI